jgi:2-dehydro-3-deoxyphosphogluconate aldolase/(4S)-4-hydroxy-2-oxoglutarate aldolase
MIQANFGTDVVARLRAARLIPVITIDDAANAVPLARALVDGGLPCAEITFRTRAAAESIARISADVPELFVGAGTVITPTQAESASEAGAQFIVAPGFSPHVVEHCRSRGFTIVPGVATPTEIEAALAMGLRTLKFFPAEPIGGLPYLKAIAAPYAEVGFVPTGGISATNVAAYLAFDRVVACGGSWMAPADWIAAGQFDRIRDETRRAVAAASGKPAAVIV